MYYRVLFSFLVILMAKILFAFEIIDHSDVGQNEKNQIVTTNIPYPDYVKFFRFYDISSQNQHHKNREMFYNVCILTSLLLKKILNAKIHFLIIFLRSFRVIC